MSKTAQDKLAINGGPPVRTAPMPERKLITDLEKQAVGDLLERGYGAMGYHGEQEEGYCREFAEFLGGGYADGVNSGTNAVYVAFRTLEVQPGSEVIVPPVSDPGGVMPIVLAGCEVVTEDAAPGHYNVGAEQIEACLSKRTSAIVVAHIAGKCVDMDPIMEIARSRGIPVLEDCAQAHGAMYKGRPAGTLGDISTFSTMFGKHHSTGGQGGVVFTTSEEMYWKVRRYADRGKPFNIDEPHGNVVASLNCNLDEIHATIGRVQLRRLPTIVARRRELVAQIAAECDRRLSTVKIVTDSPGCEDVYWFLMFKLELDRLSVDKLEFIKAFNAEGMKAPDTYLACPTRMPWYKGGNRGKEILLPNAEETDRTHFRNSGFHEDWSDADVADLVNILEKLERAFMK